MNPKQVLTIIFAILAVITIFSTAGCMDLEEQLDPTPTPMPTPTPTPSPEPTEQPTRRVPTPSLKPDYWDTFRATLQNSGDEDVYSLELGFTDDFVIRRAGLYSLKAGESETIEIPIRAKYRGRVPLDLTLTYQDEYEQSYTHVAELWVEVVDS